MADQSKDRIEGVESLLGRTSCVSCGAAGRRCGAFLTLVFPITILALFLLIAPMLRGAPDVRPPLDSPVLNPPAPPKGAHILVEKAARRLILYKDGKEERRFRVGLGFAPVGPKEVEGDGRTPEGDYRVCKKNPNSRFHLSLGVNYPNAIDAEKAYGAGTITLAQRDRIVAASRRSGCPPWNTPMGGVIFIHGSGSSSDWTLGCVALDNGDMDLLYAASQVGTPVTIRP